MVNKDSLCESRMSATHLVGVADIITPRDKVGYLAGVSINPQTKAGTGQAAPILRPFAVYPTAGSASTAIPVGSLGKLWVTPSDRAGAFNMSVPTAAQLDAEYPFMKPGMSMWSFIKNANDGFDYATLTANTGVLLHGTSADGGSGFVLRWIKIADGAWRVVAYGGIDKP